MKNRILLKLLFYSIVILYSFDGLSQTSHEIGYFLSDKFFPVGPSFAFDEMNSEPIEVTINSKEKFFHGHYIDSSGNKVIGRIKQLNTSKKIEFRLPGSEETQVLKAQDIRGFTIGIDSFNVFHQLVPMNKNYIKFEDPEFVSTLFVNDSVRLFNHIRYELVNSDDKYLMYNGHIYDMSVSQQKQISLLKDLFSHSSFLIEYLERATNVSIGPGVVGNPKAASTQGETKSVQYSLSDFLRLHDLQTHFILGDSIFLNYRQELCEQSLAKYFARVEMLTLDQIKLSYFDLKGNKILSDYFRFCSSKEVRDHSGRPGNGSNEKMGKVLASSTFSEFSSDSKIWYYSSGSVRKVLAPGKSSFDKDTVYEYFPNGQLHWKYLVKGGDARNKYMEIYDDQGNLRVSSSDDYGFESFTDTFRNVRIQRKYVIGKIKESVVFNSANQVMFHQLVKKNAKPSVDFDLHLEPTLNKMISKEMILNDEQGTVFLRVLISENGELEESEVVFGLSAETNNVVLSAVREVSKEYDMWYGARGRERTKVKQELILPIKLKYRTFKTHYEGRRNNDLYFYQNWQMNQFNQPPVEIRPPASVGE